MRRALSFDDVLLIPQYSDLTGRGEDEIDLSTQIGSLKLAQPLISSPMDTVTSVPVQQEMKRLGGIGIHHRYCHPALLMAALDNGPVAISPSLGLDFVREAVDTYEHPILVMDIAHGDSKPALDFSEQCVRLGAELWSGNICTKQAARRYYDIGVRVFRVGIGSGASCSTWKVAGAGMPQLQALSNVFELSEPDISIVSDGGIRASGDAVKALAMWADGMILGRLLAGAEEAPGMRVGSKAKVFRGMASYSALNDAGKEVNVEGEELIVDIEGSLESIIHRLLTGIRRGMAYLGARNIMELRKQAEWIQIG